MFMSFTDIVRKLFIDIKFSEKGSNARQREENTYMFFVDYLEACERGKYRLRLCNIGVVVGLGPS